MTIRTTINDSTSTFAATMATEVKARHELDPFTTVDLLSFWMHQRYNNPRIKISTNEAGTRMTVLFREDKLLTIDVQP